jgi:cytoskeletal protein RodZ
MQTNTLSSKKQLLIGLPLVLIIFAVLIIGIIWWTDNGAKRRTAAAQPEITSAEPQSWRNSKNRTENGFRVRYHFKTEAGQTVEATEERNKSYQPGTQYRVCYDPKNPSDSALHTATGSECGKGLLF